MSRGINTTNPIRTAGEEWFDGDLRAFRLAQALQHARQAGELEGPALWDAIRELDDIGHASRTLSEEAEPAPPLQELGRWFIGRATATVPNDAAMAAETEALGPR